ncbi:hypothetical protein SAMN02982927_03470 [Sporolactobacillus nakayamae]|uniref:Uncharacterized protein n=1 Tax=Sporolactobacillus nakayamae TaxID=269670 RepID=A0A1I2WDB8_9BACL|nr:hypothetical protein SAMN02982927_03470 [Sporolactobacillus nakayamae]
MLFIEQVIHGTMNDLLLESVQKGGQKEPRSGKSPRPVACLTLARPERRRSRKRSFELPARTFTGRDDFNVVHRTCTVLVEVPLLIRKERRNKLTQNFRRMR